MSHRIVRRAGIAGITVAGLLLMGSGVSSATVLPVLASGSTATSIATTSYTGCNVKSDQLDRWCCELHIALLTTRRKIHVEPLQPPYNLQPPKGFRYGCWPSW